MFRVVMFGRLFSSGWRIAVAIGWASLALVAAGFGYRFLRADVEADVYRDRLGELSTQYESLRSAYDQAVRRTAVTELVVDGGKLSVRVRTAEGVLREIPTPFDPGGEIYVDYVIIGGRLWIRRVFDARTPPADGLVIDPIVAEVDWAGDLANVGKAVYRRLDEGRWVITVTGNGSLGLARAESTPAGLSSPPIVRDHEGLASPDAPGVGDLTVGEVWRRLFGAN